MFSNKFALTVNALLLLLLSGCGGGGGGGGWSAGNSPTPFTSYGSIVFPSTVKMSGNSQEATFTSVAGTTISTVSIPSNFTSGASLTSTFNDSGVKTDETLATSTGTGFSLITANGDIIGNPSTLTNIVYGKSADGQNYLLEADHAALLWDYQNFGVWLTGSGTNLGTIGAMTVGAETLAAAVPLTGSHTFIGVNRPGFHGGCLV